MNLQHDHMLKYIKKDLANNKSTGLDQNMLKLQSGNSSSEFEIEVSSFSIPS